MLLRYRNNTKVLALHGFLHFLCVLHVLVLSAPLWGSSCCVARCPPRGPCSPVRSVRSVFKVRPFGALVFGFLFLAFVVAPRPLSGGWLARFAVRAFPVVPVPLRLLKPRWAAALVFSLSVPPCARQVVSPPFWWVVLFVSRCIFALNPLYIN